MKILKITGWVVTSGIVILLMYLFAVVPYMQGLQSDSLVYLVARHKQVDCGETCVSFYVEKAIDSNVDYLTHQYVYPYQEGKFAESVFSELKTNSVICVIGYPHRFYKGFGGLPKVGYGGYRVRMTEWSHDLARCNK